jgi:hypothetical protein
VDGKLPRWIAVVLILFGSAVLGVSVYLERTQLTLLQAHPIMVNLISGMIGFGYSVVLVAFVINGAIRRSRTRTRQPRLFSMHQKMQTVYGGLGGTIPVDIRARLHSTAMGSWYAPLPTGVSNRKGRVVGREINWADIVQGTELFLAEVDRFIEHSTQVFELLVLPDEEIANYLVFVTEELAGLRHVERWNKAPTGTRKSTHRYSDSDIRPVVVRYSLAASSIHKLYKIIAMNPEVRRAIKPKRLGIPGAQD